MAGTRPATFLLPATILLNFEQFPHFFKSTVTLYSNFNHYGAYWYFWVYNLLYTSEWRHTRCRSAIEKYSTIILIDTKQMTKDTQSSGWNVSSHLFLVRGSNTMYTTHHHLQLLLDEHFITSTHNRTTTAARTTTRTISILSKRQVFPTFAYLPHMFVHCLVI
jgi:hypothetical protein